MPLWDIPNPLSSRVSSCPECDHWKPWLIDLGVVPNKNWK
jgi:hypothetical protein